MNIDWRAVARRAARSPLILAVPFSFAARWFADNDDGLGRGHLAAACWPCVGFVLGAGIAAWVQARDLPLIHGHRHRGR